MSGMGNAHETFIAGTASMEIVRIFAVRSHF